MNNILPAYGVWEVTTEGDCEGRSVRNLGAHQGHLDDIAFALAGSAYYGLRFSLGKSKVQRPTNVKDVQVSLDIETGTWDLQGEARVAYFEKMLEGRPVKVREGNYFACVRLVNPNYVNEAAERQAALSKLTAREKALLGLNK